MTDVVFDSDGRLRPWWRFALAIPVFLLSEALGSVVASAFAAHPLIGETAGHMVSLAVLLGGFMLLLVTADQVQIEERPLAHMGLSFDGHAWLDQIGVGLAIGGVMVGIAVIAIAIGGVLHFDFVLHARTIPRIAIVLLLLMVAAMAEEVAFRGYPFQRLVESFGPLGAIIVLSVLFGLMHAGNPDASRTAVVNTILYGVILAIAYLRTRSLWFPFGIHLGWNAALGLVFGLPLSGLHIFAVIVRGHATGPEWLTGGGYGVEGSLLGSVIIIASAPAVFLIGGWLRPTEYQLKSTMPESPDPASNPAAASHAPNDVPGRIE